MRIKLNTLLALFVFASCGSDKAKECPIGLDFLIDNKDLPNSCECVGVIKESDTEVYLDLAIETDYLISLVDKSQSNKKLSLSYTDKTVPLIEGKQAIKFQDEGLYEVKVCDKNVCLKKWVKLSKSLSENSSQEIVAESTRNNSPNVSKKNTTKVNTSKPEGIIVEDNSKQNIVSESIQSESVKAKLKSDQDVREKMEELSNGLNLITDANIERRLRSRYNTLNSNADNFYLNQSNKTQFLIGVNQLLNDINNASKANLVDEKRVVTVEDKVEEPTEQSKKVDSKEEVVKDDFLELRKYGKVLGLSEDCLTTCDNWEAGPYTMRIRAIENIQLLSLKVLSNINWTGSIKVINESGDVLASSSAKRILDGITEIGLSNMDIFLMAGKDYQIQLDGNGQLCDFRSCNYTNQQSAHLQVSNKNYFFGITYKY